MYRDPDNAFGKKIKRHRILKGFSQDKLAQEIKCAAQTIHLIEAGKTNPRLFTINKLCSYFGIPIESIMYESEAK